MSWRGIITVLLLVGAAISGWSLWNQRAAQAPQAAPATRSDYVLHDFELVVLDAQGRESFTLHAPTLARDPGSKALQITTPTFLVPPRTGSDAGDSWKVHAKTGWVSPGGDELRLRGAVRASSDGVTQAPVDIATEQLTVFPEAERVTSAVAVSINRPGSILRGRGLVVNLATSRYTLQSEVQSRYAPIR